MTKGKAIATVSGHTIAETDEYEVVEGNIYVRLIIRTKSKVSLTPANQLQVSTIVSRELPCLGPD